MYCVCGIVHGARAHVYSVSPVLCLSPEQSVFCVRLSFVRVCVLWRVCVCVCVCVRVFTLREVVVSNAAYAYWWAVHVPPSPPYNENATARS